MGLDHFESLPNVFDRARKEKSSSRLYLFMKSFLKLTYFVVIFIAQCALCHKFYGVDEIKLYALFFE